MTLDNNILGRNFSFLTDMHRLTSLSPPLSVGRKIVSLLVGPQSQEKALQYNQICRRISQDAFQYQQAYLQPFPV